MRELAPARAARWLSRRCDALPDDYEGGRHAMAAALVGHLTSTIEEANQLLDELERSGHLRYAAEARSIGGSAGRWMIYVSPADNPEDELLAGGGDPEQPGEGKPR